MLLAMELIEDAESSLPLHRATAETATVESWNVARMAVDELIRTRAPETSEEMVDFVLQAVSGLHDGMDAT